MLSNCYKCLWTQGFVSFFCISIYNSLKLISPRIVLLLSIFMKVVTITLTFILTFFTSYLLVISFVFFIENIDSLLKTALKKNWYLSSKNVGRWDCSDKWNTDRVVLLWLRSTKDRLQCCLFPVFLVSLVGNIFIRTTAYKTKSLKKPLNFFIYFYFFLLICFAFYGNNCQGPRNLFSWFLSGCPPNERKCKMLTERLYATKMAGILRLKSCHR